MGITSKICGSLRSPFTRRQMKYLGRWASTHFKFSKSKWPRNRYSRVIPDLPEMTKRQTKRALHPRKK